MRAGCVHKRRGIFTFVPFHPYPIMGAVEHIVTDDNVVTTKQVVAAFHRQVENDREYNGHQEGYSGDTQTFDGISPPNNYMTPFASEKDAEKWITDTTVKWGSASATFVHRYKGVEGKKAPEAAGRDVAVPGVHQALARRG